MVRGLPTGSRRGTTRFKLLRCATAAVCLTSLPPMRCFFSAAAALASTADPIFDDLTEQTRILSLPSSTARRLESLQELEDDRLERCRESTGSLFDQCFFFGNTGGMAGSRRESSRPTDAEPEGSASEHSKGERRRTGPPTW